MTLIDKTCLAFAYGSVVAVGEVVSGAAGLALIASFRKGRER